MEHKRIEHLNKSIIEYDIRMLYIWIIKSLIPCSIFFYFGILFLWFYCDIGKNSQNPILIMIFIIYIILSLCITIYLIYLIIQCFKKNIKYSIVSDTFTGIGQKAELGYGIFGTYCLCFSQYGRFLLHFHRVYYQWSDLYCMNNNSMINRSISGDKFYLVIKNSKILNVYNQKMFILDDK